MSSLYIIIPAYNESENIEKTISDWYPVVESHNEEGNSRLVIINDGSKDNIWSAGWQRNIRCLSRLQSPMVVMALQFFMVTVMPYRTMQIIFFRLTLMDRPIPGNLSPSGKSGIYMMLS